MTIKYLWMGIEGVCMATSVPAEERTAEQPCDQCGDPITGLGASVEIIRHDTNDVLGRLVCDGCGEQLAEGIR